MSFFTTIKKSTSFPSPFDGQERKSSSQFHLCCGVKHRYMWVTGRMGKMMWYHIQDISRYLSLRYTKISDTQGSTWDASGHPGHQQVTHPLDLGGRAHPPKPYKTWVVEANIGPGFLGINELFEIPLNTLLYFLILHASLFHILLSSGPPRFLYDLGGFRQVLRSEAVPNNGNRDTSKKEGILELRPATNNKPAKRSLKLCGSVSREKNWKHNWLQRKNCRP